MEKIMFNWGISKQEKEHIQCLAQGIYFLDYGEDGRDYDKLCCTLQDPEDLIRKAGSIKLAIKMLDRIKKLAKQSDDSVPQQVFDNIEACRKQLNA